MILVTSTDEMDSYIPRTLWSVRVDLREVPLDEYNTLTQGDFVIVTGVLYDNGWLVGTSIDRAPSKLSNTKGRGGIAQEGALYRRLGQRFGLSRYTVSEVALGRRWTHVAA